MTNHSSLSRTERILGYKISILNKIQSQDKLPICLGLKGFPGCMNFSAKSWKFPANWDKLITLPNTRGLLCLLCPLIGCSLCLDCLLSPPLSGKCLLIFQDPSQLRQLLSFPRWTYLIPFFGSVLVISIAVCFTNMTWFSFEDFTFYGLDGCDPTHPQG